MTSNIQEQSQSDVQSRQLELYKSPNKIRIVTATVPFDRHDAAVNLV
ncbi:MAG: hypothetical protein ACXAEU_03110 [Candidatus Hodarchaeales archaeon]